MYLINVNETIVLIWAKKMLDQSANCKCERCYLDVVALALNNLLPKYIVSTERNALLTQDHQMRADAIKAIKSAMDLIAKRPHHHR